MLELLLGWYRRNLSDPQAVTLALTLFIGFALLYFYADILAPLLLAVVLAYLLDGPVSLLERLRLPRWLAVIFVLLLFTGLMLLALFVLLPVLWQQVMSLAHELPLMLTTFHKFIQELPYYGLLIEAGVGDSFSANVQSKLVLLGEHIVRLSMASLVTVIKWAVYIVIVPIIIFFLLKDKEQLLRKLSAFFPHHQRLTSKVWREMNLQISRYLRGKVLEILLVAASSYLLFILLGLNYALLLASLTGLSVLIPYIGAVLATIPVTIIALFQYGLAEPTFWKFMALYATIHIVDGNLLVPVFFSEALNLHPLVIILSTLVFGGLWGFWGIFFAIPLATLVKAVLAVWPKEEPPRCDG